ncbi:hypothetical protein BLNAU_9057 [Blattamonas nauphoetae]|uniref:Uncharacterized protein n=1 Tax=Blattamonas nauphoetae TaxID=2049346 RepID=A0ABQ9XX74_9EUKA|nr:hypothetical protein BLNAU_9057 [Blattamonas nauphoetae]
MRTVKHQAFVLFIQLSTDNESSQDSFIETINTVSSLLSNPDKPDSAETNPTTAKQMFDALLLSTGQELVPQHFSDEASSPNATFKPSISLRHVQHETSASSFSRVFRPREYPDSALAHFCCSKTCSAVTHPQFYTLLLDLAPQHHPAISLPTFLSHATAAFSQSEQHTFFPYPQITLPHHPHSVQHKSSKALLLTDNTRAVEDIHSLSLSHPFISSTFTPDSSPLATTHTPASTSLYTSTHHAHLSLHVAPQPR